MIPSLLVRRVALIGVSYFALHVAFDLVARVFQVMPGVSLWYPPVGLALALSTLFGWRSAPLVLLAQSYSTFFVSAFPVTWVHVLTPVMVTTVYVTAGAFTRRWFGPVPAPRRPLETGGLIALHVGAPVCAALLGTTLAVLGNLAPADRFGPIAFGWFIGDLTGVLTMAPLCLVHVAPRVLGVGGRPSRAVWSVGQLFEVLAQGLSVFACLAIMHGFGYAHAHRAYYLCFVPLVWICLRHGLPGATIAVVALTMGSLASLQMAGASPEAVTDLLLFEVALATIGLGLGATVSRRARAETERSRLLTVLEATPDFVATADLHGRVLYLNAAFLRLRGYASQAEARRHSVAENHPGWAAEKVIREGIPAALAHGQWQADVAVLDVHGREVPVSQLIVTHYDAERRPVMLSSVARNITAQKKAEAARLESERSLLQAQKLESLGVLAGGIAHDFNNLLTVMLGNATLARLDVPAHTPAEQAIHQIELAALRAAELCRQMLAYSGKGQLATSLVDLSVIVEETIDLLKISISKKCVLTFELTPGLPAVNGDATQLNQITMNLVMNASDACGDRIGRITVRTGLMQAGRDYLATTYLSPDLAPGPYVFLEVSDDGAGMSPDVLARIFEPFFTTKFTGHGLGLSAVLGIARSHDGAIKVESTPGRGTTFRLLLPAVSSDEPAASAAGPVVGEAWTGHGRVLVVDDEDAVRDIAARVLARHGFEVVAVADGRQAVDAFAREPAAFRAVLLDLTMPVMDGEEAFQEIHRLNPLTPVLLMSGYSKTASAERFEGKGMAGFIQKPFESARLVEALRVAVDSAARS